MKISVYKHVYKTVGEARAFWTGVTCVNDPDVEAEKPIIEDGEWTIYVHVKENE